MQLSARRVFEEVVAPLATRFQPDLILVSAGFDAHARDPLANMVFSSSTFHFLCDQTKRLANACCGGKVVFVLEGGYDVDALGESVCESFRALLGEPSATKAMPEESSATERVKKVVEECMRIHPA